MDLCPACGEEKPHHAAICEDCDNRINYPLDYVYEFIEKFPKTRKFKHCQVEHEVSNLIMYTECSQCHTKVKLWSFGAPKEIQDIINLCERWLKEAGKIPSK